jgi:hypothetical protein
MLNLPNQGLALVVSCYRQMHAASRGPSPAFHVTHPAAERDFPFQQERLR